MAKNNKVNGTCVEKKKEREKEKRDGRVRENILKEVKVVNSVFYNWSTSYSGFKLRQIFIPDLNRITLYEIPIKQQSQTAKRRKLKWPAIFFFPLRFLRYFRIESIRSRNPLTLELGVAPQ